MTRRCLLLALLILAAACGSAQVPQENRPRTRSDVLTLEDIQRSELLNMFEVIQRLQPSWLRAPQTRQHNLEVAVFMDGMRVGSVEFLRNIPASQVAEARYLNSRQISTELSSRQAFGVGAAIMLRSHRM